MKPNLEEVLLCDTAKSILSKGYAQQVELEALELALQKAFTGRNANPYALLARLVQDGEIFMVSMFLQKFVDKRAK